MSDRLRHVIGLLASPWAITPDAYQTICGIIDRRADGIRLTDTDIDALVAESQHAYELRAAAIGQINSQGRGIAVLSLYGVMVPRANLMSAISGGASMEQFAAKFQQADADPNIMRIVLDIDSPGGLTDLVPETAAVIRAAQTPVTAIANTMAASGAYWLASQADEIVVTPSGLVGSIGVFGRHVDISGALEQDGINVTLISAGRFKTEGNEYEPLSAEGLAARQAMVDDMYALFVGDVAAGRGVSAQEVADGYGQGRVLTASQALREGMVDRVDTFAGTVGRLLQDQTRGLRADVSMEPPLSAATGHSFDCACKPCHAYWLSRATSTTQTSPVEPEERPGGADKPAPLHPRVARAVAGR